jgi:hypothetical protein
MSDIYRPRMAQWKMGEEKENPMHACIPCLASGLLEK